MRRSAGIYTTGRKIRVAPRSSSISLQQRNGQDIATTFECACSCIDSRWLHYYQNTKRALAVRRATHVHAHGIAAAWGVAIGLVGGNGFLSVDASRRLRLCARPDDPA